MLELPGKDFKEAIIKCSKSNHKHTWIKQKTRKSLQAQRRYKEEPKGNFRTEKYNNRNKLTCWAQEQNGDNRAGANGLKDKSIEISNLNNREKELKKNGLSLGKLWDINKRFNL